MTKILLRNTDNKFVDRTLPYITISAVNGYITPEFDKEAIAKKCEEKGKREECKWTGLSAQDIINMWEEKANVSREYGKLVDDYAEVILEGKDKDKYVLNHDVENDERLRNHCLAFDQFYERIMKSGDVIYIGREIEVWNKVKVDDEEFYVKGRLDALFYNKRIKTYIIVDWKSNECITTNYNKWTNHLLGPASILHNIDWNTYSMQVYNYKEALLQNYLPEGTDPNRVKCMIVNLPKAAYDNNDAVLGKGQNYKAYLPAFEYKEDFLNEVFSYAYKKDKLERKKKQEEKNKQLEAKEEEFDLF